MHSIKESLPSYANDLKLNLSSVIENSIDSDLSVTQIAYIALASSYTTRVPTVIDALEKQTDELLNETAKTAAKAAAAVMAMNNVYYRATHLMSDEAYSTMPAKLRMNVIAQPGIERVDFELMSLAISAINGCGKCLDAHAKVLDKAGIRKTAIQHTIRIAAVINSLAQVMSIEKADAHRA